ncbi:MAG: hypothetical protein ACR2JW_05280 [Thermomicrobiales bacterium]
MSDTQATNFLHSVGTQPPTDAERLIEGKLRDWTPLGDFLTGKGWVNPLPPTATRPDAFVEQVGIVHSVVVTYSGVVRITFGLTSEITSTTMDRAITVLQSVGDAMVSTAPTVNVQPGMRVELTGKPTAVTLRGRTGTVVREDEDEDYVIVELDIPALYRHFNGEVEELPEIVVMVDNLRVLGH